VGLGVRARDACHTPKMLPRRLRNALIVLRVTRLAYGIMRVLAALARASLALYVVAVAIGVAVGLAWPELESGFEAAIWPVLGGLLYVTFLQVQIRALPSALGDRRFLAVLLGGNFLLMPLLLWGLLQLVVVHPAVQVGIVMVLLAPCTDWFTSFTHLGRGDARLAIASTPLLLALQFLLLPVYLGLMTELELGVGTLPLGPIALAFVGVILLPLLSAGVTQESRWGRRQTRQAERWMVPLLAATLFLIAASQAPAVWDAGDELGRAVGIFALYLVVAALLARVLAPRARLSVPASRTVAFSLGTRNSFVVLPLALTLPDAYALAVPVIAVQSLVELGGMLVYLRVVPGWLFPERVRG